MPNKYSAPIADLLNALAEGLDEADVVCAAQTASISNTIANKRISLGMNQKQFADYLGKSQPTVSKWETGDCNFTVATLAEIACKLGFSLDIRLREANGEMERETNIVKFPGGYYGAASQEPAWSQTGSWDDELLEM